MSKRAEISDVELERFRRLGYLLRPWPSPDGSKGRIYVRIELDDPSAHPYFLQDKSTTVRDLRVRLRSARGREWCQLAGKVLREARPDDSVFFIPIQQIQGRWEQLSEYVGSMREFWLWLFGVWNQPASRNGYRSFDSLLARFWKAQGFSTWTTNALLHSGIRSWADIEPLTRTDLLKLPYLGKGGVARIEELLNLRRPAKPIV